MNQNNTQLLNYYSDEDGLCYLVIDSFEAGQKQKFVAPVMEPTGLLECIKSIARYESSNVRFFDTKGTYKDICLYRRKIKFGKELESFLVEFAWQQTFFGRFLLPEYIRKKPYDSSLDTPDLLDGL